MQAIKKGGVVKKYDDGSSITPDQQVKLAEMGKKAAIQGLRQSHQVKTPQISQTDTKAPMWEGGVQPMVGTSTIDSSGASPTGMRKGGNIKGGRVKKHR
jgi:hypothetical protein